MKRWAPRKIKTGEGFQVWAKVPRGAKNGDKPTTPAITPVIEKDEPLTSPATGVSALGVFRDGFLQRLERILQHLSDAGGAIGIDHVGVQVEI